MCLSGSCENENHMQGHHPEWGCVGGCKAHVVGADVDASYPRSCRPQLLSIGYLIPAYTSKFQLEG